MKTLSHVACLTLIATAVSAPALAASGSADGTGSAGSMGTDSAYGSGTSATGTSRPDTYGNQNRSNDTYGSGATGTSRENNMNNPAGSAAGTTGTGTTGTGTGTTGSGTRY